MVQKILQTFTITEQDVAMICAWALFFAAFVSLMSKYVFGPFLRLVEARERATSGAQVQARAITERAERLSAEFDQKITQTRIESMKLKIEEITKAKVEASRIVEEGEREAREITRRAREEIEARLGALREEVQQKSDALVEMVVQKVRSIPAAD